MGGIVMKWLRKLFNKKEKQTLRDKLIEMYGEEAGICWGADISDDKKNFQQVITLLLNVV